MARFEGHSYTAEEIAEVRSVLLFETSLADARARIEARLGHEMTSDALNALCKRHFGSPPSKLLGASPRPFTGAKIQDLGDDEMGGPTLQGVEPMEAGEHDTEPPDTEPASEPNQAPDQLWLERSGLYKHTVPMSGHSEWIVIPDAHSPFISSACWSILKSVVAERKPHGCIVMGDFSDFYAVSSHERNASRSGRLVDELDITNAYLDDLDAMGFKTKYFILGNHEDRLTRYITKNASALEGLPGLTAQELMRLGERGWTSVPYLDSLQVGDCMFTHTTSKWGGMNAHKKARDQFHASTVIGHTHRFGYEMIGDFFGGARFATMLGCFFDLGTVDYLHRAEARANWVNGFGLGVLDHARGRMHITPVPIVDGSCSVGGRILEAA